jgi:flagellar hook-length control protein FliK
VNIENNWGMNLASGGLSGTAASGVQSMQTGVLSGREKSLFQQMISRMLTEQNPAADGENAPAGSQGLLGGDLLSALMLQGGSSAGILLQNAGMEAKADVQTDGTAMKNSEAAESLQALMAGLFGAVPVLNPEKGTLEIQSDPNGSNLEIAGAGTILAGGAAGNRQNAGVPSTLWKGPAELTGILTDPKTLQAGGAVSGTGQSFETAAQNGNALVDSLEKDSVIGNLDLSQTMAQKSSDVMQGGEAEKSFSLSGIGTGRGADGNRASAEIADGGNSKQESGWLNPDSLGFRNDLSGAAAGASELNRAAQSVGANEPYSQIGNEILTKLEQKGPAEFRMQLEPEDLGQIDIKLKFSEGKLMIDILAASARTQALLTSQVDKLISSLGLQNVHVESVQVSGQTNSQAQDSSQGQAFTMHSSMDFSQRRQQEQLQQQSSGGRPDGSFSLRQDELTDSDPMSRVESTRYDFSRMNYIV